MKKGICGAAAILIGCTLLPQVASAVPFDITEFSVFRADRNANPLGFQPTALNVIVAVQATTATPITGTTVTLSTLDSTNALRSFNAPLAFGPAGLFGRAIFEIPYDATLTNQWTFSGVNGADTDVALRQAFLPVAAMPFVENISFTGTSSNVIINWDVTAAGASRLDRQQVSIWDLTDPTPLSLGLFNVGTAARSVDISSLGLTQGRQYSLEILNVEHNNTTGATDVFSGYWLSNWQITDGAVQVPAAVPEPATLGLMLAGLAGIFVSRRRRARAC
jgi:hypothetical protein